VLLGLDGGILLERMQLNTKKIRAEANWELSDNADAMLDRVAQCIRRSVEEILGVSRRGGGRKSGAWW